MSDQSTSTHSLITEDVEVAGEQQLDECIACIMRTVGEHEQVPFHVCIMLTDEETIQELNRTYRSVDSVTDVLSFPALDFSGRLKDCRIEIDDADFSDDGCIEVGDIAICVSRAAEQARQIGHSLHDEIAFLALHGVLHLLGYDHEEPDDEEEMTALQRTILNNATEQHSDR